MTKPLRFLAFVAIGGLAAAINLGARVVFDLFVSYEVSIVLAFPIALTVAFALNRTLVFRSRQKGWAQQYRRFLLVNLAALAQVFVISVALARLLFPSIGFISAYAETVAHAIGLAAPIFTSYWAHGRYSFAEPQELGQESRA